LHPDVARAASHVRGADAGTTDLGDSVRAASLASVHVPSRQEPVAQDLPPEPFPGQIKPDARGQCPGRDQLPINGGCWVEQRTKEAEACAQNGYVLFKDRCYAPALAPRRKPQPTSNPMEPQ
jgi:serine/threonine-protein kinase